MTYDAGDYDASMRKALELSDYAGLAARKAESAKKGMKRGIGFSAYIEACGIAPSAAVGSLGAGVGLWESAEVRVNPTGSVEVLTGSHSHGQGHETTFAQLVSQKLGIPIEQVTVVHGDTDKVQFGMGTYGSRSGAVGMSAIFYAADKVIVKAKKVAGFVLEVPPETVDFKEGIFSSTATNKTLTFPEVALQAYIAHKFTGAQLEPGLKEGAFFDPTNFTFPSGVHICELEIDPETGATRIDRWTAVDDFGTLINPMIVEGQVHGGVAQGVGQAHAGRRRLRQERPAHHGELHGLHHAARRRPAVDQDRHDQHALPVEPARHQGLRRGRRHRRTGCRRQRPDRCAGPRGHRHAGNAARRVARRAEVAHQDGCGIGSRTMYAFEYHRPQSVADAAKLLASNSEAKLLAGGHTLVPTMKHAAGSAQGDRRSQPGGGAASGIDKKGNALVIGAMTTHAEVADSAVVRSAIAGLADVAGVIGDPHVRHRGTIGGSVANNDPAADYPAALLALGATIGTNKREIKADDFFKGLFTTALQDGEIITRISFPIPGKFGYEKFRQSGLALCAGRSRGGADRIVGARRGHGRRQGRRVPPCRHGSGPRQGLVGAIAQRRHHRRRQDDERHPRRRGLSRASGRRHGPPRRRQGRLTQPRSSEARGSDVVSLGKCKSLSGT